MIEVKQNVFYTNGVLIQEPVYIRTIQSTGIGEEDSEDADSIKLTLQGIFFLKSDFLINNIQANKIPIDNFSKTFYTTLSKIDAFNGVNFAFFNSLFIDILKEKLTIQEENISILKL